MIPVERTHSTLGIAGSFPTLEVLSAGLGFKGEGARSPLRGRGSVEPFGPNRVGGVGGGDERRGDTPPRVQRLDVYRYEFFTAVTSSLPALRV